MADDKKNNKVNAKMFISHAGREITVVLPQPVEVKYKFNFYNVTNIDMNYAVMVKRVPEVRDTMDKIEATLDFPIKSDQVEAFAYKELERLDKNDRRNGTSILDRLKV